MAQDPQPVAGKVLWTLLPSEWPLCFPGTWQAVWHRLDMYVVSGRTSKRGMVSPLLSVEVHSVSTPRLAHWPVGDLDIVLWRFLPSASSFLLVQPQSLPALTSGSRAVTGGTPGGCGSQEPWPQFQHFPGLLDCLWLRVWDSAIFRETVLLRASWRQCGVGEKSDLKLLPFRL